MPVIPAIYSRTELSFFGDCPPFYLHTNAEVGAGFRVWECRQGGRAQPGTASTARATAGVVFVPLASLYQKRTGSWFKFGEIIQGISMNCDV